MPRIDQIPLLCGPHAVWIHLGVEGREKRSSKYTPFITKQP
jgi:hypothetical protein